MADLSRCLHTPASVFIYGLKKKKRWVKRGFFLVSHAYNSVFIVLCSNFKPSRRPIREFVAGYEPGGIDRYSKGELNLTRQTTI